MRGSNLQVAFSTSSVLDCRCSLDALVLVIDLSTGTTATFSSNSNASFCASIVLDRRRQMDPLSGITLITPSGCNPLSIVRAKLCL